jgi:LPPG:FO 2-phospho-L-lactate transferase
VTPIIAGQAVKGPTAKIMRELDLELSVRTIANHYRGLIDGFVLDTADTSLAASVPVQTLVTNTLMRQREDKVALARACIAFCERITKSRQRQSAQ